MGKEKTEFEEQFVSKTEKAKKAMGKTDYGKYCIKHGVCTMK